MIKYSTRLVFILPKIVFKFPIDRRGYLQGKNEKKLWNKYKATNLLGELIFEFLGIVIMKRYSRISNFTDYDVVKIKMSIKELDIDNCDLYNPENWADGKLIDYGINEYISKLY
jgi:hypothetical protein